VANNVDKFEYFDTMLPDMEKLGKDGWELVSVVREHHQTGSADGAWANHYFFKRKTLSSK